MITRYLNKNLSRLLRAGAYALLAGALALGGCSKDEAGGPEGGEFTVVEFTAGINTATGPAIASAAGTRNSASGHTEINNVIPKRSEESTAGPQTRTTDGGDAWADGDKVGIFMVSAGGTLGADILTVGGTSADNREYNVNHLTGALTPQDGGKLYYPQDGSPVDFIAYYPFADPSSGRISADHKFTFSIANQTSEEEQNKLDILYAKTSGAAKSKTAVDLQFNHVLSKVTFNISLGEGMEGLSGDDITEVTFGEMPITARIDLNTGMLGTFFNALHHTALKINGIASHDAVFSSLFIPHISIDNSVNFTVGSETFVWPIPNDEKFLAGEHYVYPVTIQHGTIQVGERQIADWKRNDHGTGDALPPGIHTPDELVEFSAAWNAATTDAARQAVIDDWSQSDGTIYLWADLDISSVANFTPIGTDFGNRFTGTFDGQGHTIKNLTVNRGSEDYAGLFGWIGEGGKVTGIKLEDCDIKGGSNVGSIAGRNSGTVSGCEITGGTITATGDYSGGIVGYNFGTLSRIEKCKVSGNPQISAANNNAGGIAGYNSGTVSGCEITGGTITAKSENSGGIAGYNYEANANIENCTVSGDFQIQAENRAAGIAGYNSGTVSGCDITGGSITALNINSGGISGYNNNGTIENCKVSGNPQIQARYDAGGIAAFNRGIVRNCQITGGTITASGNNSGGIVGYNSGTLARIENCTVTGNPEIKAESQAGGIAGYIVDGTISACKITGGNIRASSYSGGITGWNRGTIGGCISAPQIITGNTSTTGFVAGVNANNSTISDTYYCRIMGTAINNAVGLNEGTVTRGGEFNRTDVKQTDNFFTTGPTGLTPIHYMNNALQAAGSTYRWQPGTAASDWWPVTYEIIID